MRTFDLGDTTFLEIGNIIVPVSDVRFIERGPVLDGVVQRFRIAIKSFNDDEPTFVEGSAAVGAFDTVEAE